MADNNMLQTIYHVEFGAKEMYALDARSACQTFPTEWQDEPWPAPEPAKAGKADKDEAARPEKTGPFVTPPKPDPPPKR